MTTEIVQFKCPSCGHLLGEEEYLHACQKNERYIDEQTEQKLQQKIKLLEIQHATELRLINEKNELEKEKEVNTRVANSVREQSVWMELKYKQDIAIKDKQIESLKIQSATQIDEKIRRAIIENESKHQQREKEFELQHSRIESDNKKLMDQVEKLQKTLDNIPPELRGTAGEFVLLDELKKEFGLDEFTPKKVGVAMADIMQIIVTKTGERITNPIVYDKKTDDSVTALDIAKAKKYKTIHNTDHCIIVTKDIKDNRLTEERQGILLVHPVAVVDIARQIRSLLVETSRQWKNNKGRDSKQAKLYEHFTSSEYARDLKSRLDTKSKLDELQRKEEDYVKTVWSKRKEFVNQWFELDKKNDRIITDIAQDDVDIEPK
jgi:hypothetical protein